MIFNQGERFKHTHEKALCPCKCTEHYNWGTKKFGSHKGPKIVPDCHPKREEYDNQAILYPNINPVRPRSATTTLRGTAHRFGFMEPGKDSPGPTTYRPDGIFDKTYRLRNRPFHTFGAGTRWEVKKEGGDVVATDALGAFKFTAIRSPTAVLLSRHTGYIKDDTPGPGAYPMKRELPSKGPKLKPDYFKRDKPVVRPGFLYLSVPLLKKTHSHANFGAHSGTCAHTENHNYCCKNCCKICGRGGPVRTQVDAPSAQFRRPRSAVGTRRGSSPTPSPAPVPESAFHGSADEGFEHNAPSRNRPTSAPAIRRLKPTDY